MIMIEAKSGIVSKRQLMALLYIVVDYLAILLGEYTALELLGVFRSGNKQMVLLSWDYVMIFIPCMFLLILFQSNCYRFNRPSIDVARDVFKGCCFCFFMYMLVIFFMRNEINPSRFYMVVFFAFMVLYIAVLRYIAGKLVMRAGCFKEDILLIGAGKTAERLLEAMEADSCYCYRVAGILDDNPVSKKLPKLFPVLGGFRDSARVFKRMGIRTVVIAVPGISEEGMRLLVKDIQHITDTILFTPSMIGVPVGSLEISTLFVEQMTIIKNKNNLSRWENRAIKYMFDIVVTFVGTLLISPVLVGLSLLVFISNKGGKVCFVHRRIGRNGKPFPCYKFCTMVPDAEKVLEQYLSENADARQEWEENFKLVNDPRVTKFGAFLRRTSLDELPQVFNVLRGEMSLVGPRPIVEDEIEKYGANIHEYFMVRPGITGVWQTSGRSDITYKDRVEMDTWYVRNWSVWIDIKYLFKTFGAVIKKKGAY